MKNVITISRQLGSGGSLIGQAVATRLGMKYLDREILRLVCEDLGCEESDIAGREESVLSFWDDVVRSFSMSSPDMAYVPPALATYLSDRELFETEMAVMRRLCEERDCVVMGRAGAHVLKGHANIMSVFVHAPVSARTQHLKTLYPEMTEAEVQRAITDSDRQRRRFTERFTGSSWTDAGNYHLCIDTSRIGHDDAIALIVSTAEKVFAS